MSFLDELLADAAKMFEDAEPEFVPVVLAGRQVGVRFMPLSGEDWNELAVRNPPREGVPREARLGYNISAMVLALPHVAIVNGDEVDDMQRDGGSVWPRVWASLTAQGRKDVEAAVWAAHERTPERLVEAAGKG